MGGGASKQQKTKTTAVVPIQSAQHKDDSDSVEIIKSELQNVSISSPSPAAQQRPPVTTSAASASKKPVIQQAAPQRVVLKESAAPIENTAIEKSVRAPDATFPGAVPQEEDENQPHTVAASEPNPQPLDQSPVPQPPQKLDAQKSEVFEPKPPRDSKFAVEPISQQAKHFSEERLNRVSLSNVQRDQSLENDEGDGGGPPPKIMGAFGGDSELETSGGGGIVTGVKGLLGMKKKAEVVVIKQNAEGSNKNDGNIALDRLDSVDSLEAFETAVIEKQQVVTSPGYATDATVVTNKKSTAIPTQSDGAHPFGFFD